MYRGQLRNEYVRILKRTTTPDGAGGSVSTFEEVIHPRYFCRLWRVPVERNRTDTGNQEATAFGILGDSLEPHPIADEHVGDKVIDEQGREFILTRWWNEKDGRVKAHAEGRLRLVSP